MRTHTGRHASRSAQRVREDRRRSTSLPPERELSDRDSLLDHLDDSPEALSQGWARAKTDPIDLPHRDELERSFGRSLDHVQVYAGPGARSLLDALGAVGATRGQEILLTGDDAPIETVAHEVAHALQSGPASTGDYPGVLPESHEAEATARASARDALDGVPSSDQPHVEALNKGWVALLRRQGNEEFPDTGLEDPEAPRDVPVDDPPAAEEAEEESPPPAARARRPAPAGGAAAPAEGARSETAPREAEAEETETSPEAEGEREPQPAAERLAPGPDRQQEIRDVLDAGQETWDTTSGEASDHEATVCPCGAIQEGEQPFVRGPPLDVPAVNPEAPAPPAEPEPVNEESFVSEADTAASRQLDRGPPAADTPATSQGEQRDEVRELEREIREEAPPEIPETPELSLTGESDPALITDREQQLDVEVDANGATALIATHEDFGETRLAPIDDPTLGHDASLDHLDVPEVSLHELLPAETLDRVATDANAGSLPLDEVLVARDEDMQQCRETTALQAETRQTVATHLADSETALARMCSRSCGQRDAQLESGRAGVGDRRTEWQAEIDGHVALRRGEGENLVRTRQEHIDHVSRDTDQRAGRRMSTARTEADRRWRETGTRAANKTQEGHDPSWWEQGIDWFRRQLDRLRGWIHDFIDGCRRAIHAFLEASRDAAHAIVEAGHRAVTATIELTRHGLDVIADNLPGELGAIAREWRDDAHEFLDGVQTRVDSIAEDLHQSIDDEIDGLIEQVDRTLDGLEEGLIGAVDLLDEMVESGPLMAILRRYFPDLARLVESGLDSVAQWAADRINGWLDTVVSTIGLNDLTAWLEDLHSGSICGPQSEESAQEACAAFEGLLGRATAWFDSILQSPAAQSVRQWLQEGTDAATEQQVDQLANFLDFVQAFVAPLYTAWQAVESAASSVMEVLGDVGRTVWRHVAEFLGIDPDIDPLTALRNGIQALWDAVVEATRPLVDGLRDAWHWIRDESPIAWFINFISSLPDLWNQLTDFAGRIVDGIGAAITAAADFFSTTLLPAIEGALQAVSRLMHGLIDRASVFIDGIYGVLQQLLSWESGIALLDALLHVAQAIFAPIVAACRVMQDCVLAFWRAIADGVANLLHWIRVFLDISVGIVVALSFPPVSFITFFAGAIWLYLVPHCCKAPIINFFLDICIRLLRFLPEPADFMLAALYNGTMAFLETLRDAPDDQKIRAMDLFASIFAGNVEVAAGFAVGLVAGVWESTGGTLIFLVQALAWLVMLPFKLGQWAIGLANGTTEEDGVAPPAGAAPEGAPGEAAPPEEAVDDSDAPLGRTADPPGVRAAEERPAGEPSRETEALPAEGTTSEGATAASAGGGPARSPAPVEESSVSATAEENARARAEPDDTAARADERAGALGPGTEEEEASDEEAGGEEAEDIDEAEAGVEEEEELGGDDDRAVRTAERPPSVRGPPPGPGAAAAAPAGRLPVDVTRAPSTRPSVPPAVRDVPPPENTAAAPVVSEAPEDEAADEEAADAEAATATSDGETGTTAAPEGEEAAPEAPDLSAIGDFFRQLATEGFTREDVRELLNGIRAASRTLVRSLAQSAARSMLEFLNNPASAFRIGVVMGTIAGMLVVEILLAVFTGGASTAVTAAKTALMASRGVARLASVVARLRRALQPLFELVNRIRRTAQGLLSRVMGWLDNVVQWMSRTLRRFIGRGHAPRPPVRAPPVRAPPVRGPRAPRRAPGPRPARRPARTGPRRPSGARRGGPRRPTRPGRPGRPPRGRGRRPPRRTRPGRGRRPPRRRGRPRRRRRRRRQPGISGRVRIAATAAWRAVVAAASGRVVVRTAVLGPARNAARLAAPGISIRVAARHLPGLPLWTLRVTGRRGRRRATVSRGRAWYARNEARQPRYSASRNQTAKHHTLTQNLNRTMERHTTRTLQTEPDPSEIQRRLAPAAARFAAAPRPRPLIGVRLDLQPDRGQLDATRTHLSWRYALGPNMARGHVRVGLVPHYLTGRTRDLTHYLLRTARPRIRSLGPYELSAHRITQPQRFVYGPDPAAWATAAYSARRWRACLETIQFVPEHRRWDAMQRRFVRDAGDHVLAQRRARSMRGEVVGLSRAATRRAIVEALLQYQDARQSRPARSVNTEERYGGHIVERHVLGTGDGIQNLRDLARRAAFGEIVVRGRIRWRPGGRSPTAFASLRDANIALRAASGEIRIMWTMLRNALADTNPPAGSFDWAVATPPVQAVRARRAQGAVFPAAERPRYLRWRFVGPRAAGAGTRPIIPEDVAAPAPSDWSRWVARQPAVGPGAPQPANPLANLTHHPAVTRAQLVVRPTTTAGAAGWFVLTLYPLV